MQRILILILLLSASFLSSGQFTIQTNKIFGGNSLDEAKDLAVNSDTSRIFWGGRTSSTDGDIPSNAGGSDYWIMKWDLDGNLIWNKTFGGVNNDDLTTVMPHNDGGVIGFGTTRNDQGLFGTLNGISGGWLMRTDPDGNMVIGQIYGGNIIETAIDAVRLVTGHVVMALEATSPILDGKANNGLADVWIVNVDAGFNTQWTALMGGSLQDSPAAIAADINSNIYVAATSHSNLTGLDPNHGGEDVWVFKLGPQGNLLWQKNFGGTADDVATDILFHRDGFVYVAAYSASDDGDFNTNRGSNDLWLIKLDADDGATRSMTRYGGEGNDMKGHLDRYGSGQLVIAATTTSHSFDLTGNKGFSDIWVLTTDLNGNLTQQMNYGGSLNDVSADVMTIDTTIHLFNTSQSSDKNVPVNTISQQDIWYISLNTKAPPCSGQFLCLPDSTLNNELFPPSTDVLLCVEGCNAGLAPGPFFLQGPCADFEHATAFFKITTDANADLLTLSVSSDEFNLPQIALLRSGNCSSFTQIKCATGANGIALLQYIKVDPLTTYIVAIDDAEGNEGSFNLCATALNVELCNKKDTLYVTHTSLGSAPHGPYKPGENVQFCYELLNWNKLDCNGFQGLIPTFGPGWDSTGFDAFGMPVQVDSMLSPVSNGFWDWYKVGDVRYNIYNPINGFEGSQGMPAGWYFTNLGDFPPNNGPDETTGDINNCMPTSDKWKICFTLPVVEDCTTNLDASVGMHTFSDGELGSRESLACAYDQGVIHNGSMMCCLNPGIGFINEVTICSKDTAILFPQTNIAPPVTYSWIAYPDDGVQGSFSQNNALSFFQILNNETNSILKVHYALWAEGSGCQTDPIEFDVQVLPLPTVRITLTGPPVVCSGSTVTLNFECTGTSPFAIELLRDNIFFANVLSESSLLSIDVEPIFSSRFKIGSVHDANCEGDGLGFVNITVKPVGSSFIDTSICEGEFVMVGTQVFTEAGVYTIRLDQAASNNCDSIVSLTLTVTPSLTETIAKEICNGDTVFVFGIPYTHTTDELIEYTGPEGCPDFIHLQLLVIDTFFTEIDQTICAGDTLEFGGNEVYQAGIYQHVEETNPGCFEKTTLTLTVLPAIVIHDLSVIGDDGSGNGAILVEIIGGSPPYTYLWNTNQTTGSLFTVAHGQYTLTVTDSRGCQQTFTFVVPMVTNVIDPAGPQQQLNIWPNLVSSGDKINIFSPTNKDMVIQDIKWWDESGHLVTSIDHLGLSIPASMDTPVMASGSLCFVRITSANGESFWFKIVIQ